MSHIVNSSPKVQAGEGLQRLQSADDVEDIRLTNALDNDNNIG